MKNKNTKKSKREAENLKEVFRSTECYKEMVAYENHYARHVLNELIFGMVYSIHHTHKTSMI